MLLCRFEVRASCSAGASCEYSHAPGAIEKAREEYLIPVASNNQRKAAGAAAKPGAAPNAEEVVPQPRGEQKAKAPAAAILQGAAAAAGLTTADGSAFEREETFGSANGSKLQGKNVTQATSGIRCLCDYAPSDELVHVKPNQQVAKLGPCGIRRLCDYAPSHKHLPVHPQNPSLPMEI